MTKEQRIREKLEQDLKDYQGEVTHCGHGETADKGDHDFSKRERFIINGEKWKPKDER